MPGECKHTSVWHHLLCVLVNSSIWISNQNDFNPTVHTNAAAISCMRMHTAITISSWPLMSRKSEMKLHIKDEMHSAMEQYSTKLNWMCGFERWKACARVCTDQTPLTQRVERALGAMVDPCCMKPPTGNQKLLPSEYWLISRLQRPFRQGWGLYHS